MHYYANQMMSKGERKATLQLERLKIKLQLVISLKERDYLKQEIVDELFHVILFDLNCTYVYVIIVYRTLPIIIRPFCFILDRIIIFTKRLCDLHCLL